MKVLVTGCAGYIGSVLVDFLLKQRYTVIGVDNLIYNNGSALFGYVGHPLFEFHRLSVCEEEKIFKLAAEADVIIPLAAIVGAPACDKKGYMARVTNHYAVANLVKTLSNFQTVIYPNTNSGYGQTDGESFCTEEDKLTPISLYAVTKCDAEQAVLSHPRGASLRLATVFGVSPRPRLDLMVNDFTSKLVAIREGRKSGGFPYNSLRVFDPHFRRNFVHVRDVCRAFIHVMKLDLTGAYNVGLPAANLTKMELAHKVCDVIGLDRGAVGVGEGEDPDQRNYLVSVEKLYNTYFRCAHGLDEGIREIEQLCLIASKTQLKKMGNVA